MKRILVIEDNLAHAMLAELLLSRGGYQVLTAGEAETGLATAQTQQPDLILLDMQLPGMDGLAALTALKAQPETRNIPVIAVSAFLDQFPEAQLHAAGCVDVIAKPYRWQDVLQRVDRVCKPPAD